MSGAILRNREGLFVATFFSRIVILSRAATSQSKQQESFHRRDAEYAVVGIFLVQELFTPRPPRLGGECPSCFSPRRRRGSQRDLLLQHRNSTISIQHLKRSTSASMTRENFAPVALPDVREKWSTSTDATR